MNDNELKFLEGAMARTKRHDLASLELEPAGIAVVFSVVKVL